MLEVEGAGTWRVRPKVRARGRLVGACESVLLGRERATVEDISAGFSFE